MSVSATACRAPSHSVVTKKKEEVEMRKEAYERYKERISGLPKDDGWCRSDFIYNYHGFWFMTKSIVCLEGVMAVQDTFKAESTDILLPTMPKCGTTWLKALAFAIMNRKHYNANDSSNHFLLTANPHECVPFLETQVFQNKNVDPFAQMASPRLLATHIPYSLLPESVLTSGCRLVYICRNPKDMLVSWWFFLSKMKGNKDLGPRTLEEAFELFCKGVTPFGPYWDHVLEYYKASLEYPSKIMFLKYEDMKMDTVGNVKRIAEFLGKPFSIEEEAQGVIQQIVDLCSFEKMISLEVNKSGILNGGVPNNAFFRKGEIGDFINYLTPEMIDRIDRITEEKFSGFNLSI